MEIIMNILKNPFLKQQQQHWPCTERPSTSIWFRLLLFEYRIDQENMVGIRQYKYVSKFDRAKICSHNCDCPASGWWNDPSVAKMGNFRDPNTAAIQMSFFCCVKRNMASVYFHVDFMLNCVLFIALIADNIIIYKSAITEIHGVTTAQQND